jgi:hypothetical protein
MIALFFRFTVKKDSSTKENILLQHFMAVRCTQSSEPPPNPENQENRVYIENPPVGKIVAFKSGLF